MRCECEYNPVRDIEPVSQTGFVDLALANANNSLPANIESSALSYNGIDDPNSVSYRPTDEFEMMQANKAIVEYGSKSSDDESK